MAAMEYLQTSQKLADQALKDDEEASLTTEDATSSAEEEVSSTEGGSATPVSEDAEPQQIFFEPVTEEEKQEALRQYGERFGRDLSGNLNPRMSFPLKRKQPASKSAGKNVESVLAELDRDLAPRPKVAETVEEPAASVSGDFAQLADSVEDGLRFTFGYAASLSENPPFAKFDIRDHICLKVGGFTHGQVVSHRGGGHLVVVGVKPVDGVNRLWFHPTDLGRPGAGAFRGVSRECVSMRVSLEQDQKAANVLDSAPHFYEMRAEDFDGSADSDGEEVRLCCHCRLPVGSQAYLHGEKQEPVHGECKAQLMQNDMKQKEDAQKQKNKELKQKDREEYDIGWNVSNIPDNVLPAVELGCPQVPEGMCCLVFDKEGHTASVAPTLEPAEAMNLEYLSVALRVKLSEGREPLFSLDPVDASQKWEKDAMQVKRFEPEWLAGTSVGEVMFQADYHLKELSMGEFDQPVVGMKSCFDFVEADGLEKEWNAREWFIVRKAEVLETEDNVLVPRVRMGVEAREMTVEHAELVDMKTTRPNHPMVKFAESFTHNFDLIAERKSVIFHLRELAKASVMAKMLIDGNVNLYGPWLEVASPATDICCMEVPQLWNEREYAKIHVNKGEILKDGALQEGHTSHGIYGGVNFGLEKAPVSVPSAVTAGRLGRLSKPAAGLSAVGLAPIGRAGITPAPTVALSVSTMAPPPAAAAAAAAAPAFTSALPSFTSTTLASPAVRAPGAQLAASLRAAAGVTTTATGLQAMSAPQGVLLKPGALIPGKPAVGLSAMTMPISMSMPGMGISPVRLLKAPEAPKALMPAPRRPGLALTAVLGADPRGVDLNLDQFSLSQPVKMEGGSWDAAQDVKRASLGSTFFQSLDGPGSEFREEDKQLLHAIYQPNLCDRRQEGDQFIPPDTSFEYVQRLRSLVKEEELCRAVRKQCFLSSDFSVANPGPLFPATWKPSVEIKSEVAGKAHAAVLRARPEYKDCSHKFDHVLKSTVPSFDRSNEENSRFRIYQIGSLEVRTIQESDGKEVVSAVFSVGDNDQKQRNSGTTVDEAEKIVKITEYVEKAEDGRCSYIEFVTEQGSKILTEKLPDGSTTWAENPSTLEERNSFAKVVRQSDCASLAVNFGLMKSFVQRESTEASSSRSKRKQYAQAVYTRVAGDSYKQDSGFWKDEAGSTWQLPEQKYGLYASRYLQEQQKAEKVQEQSGRPRVGDKVRVKASGRVGEIVMDDRGEMPYKVSFEDGESPKTKWLKESQVQRLQ